MANFLFTIFANTNPEPFRVIMYEATAPGTAVATIDVPLPHTASQQVAFTNLNAVTHWVRVYELTGGTTLGPLLRESLVMPQELSISQKASLTLHVGTDMPANQDTYDGSAAHPDMVGLVAKVDYEVEQRSIGSQTPAEYDDIGQPGFGFVLKNGALFNQGDTWFIHFLSKLITGPSQAPTASGGGYLSDIVTVTADTQLSSTHLNKLVDIQSATNKITITLDFIANVPDISMVGFVTNRGAQINAVIKAKTGEAIYYNGSVNDVVMSRLENLLLMKKGTGWYVMPGSKLSDDAGSTLFGFAQTPNTIIADGSILQRDVYVKLWRAANSLTSGSGIVALSLWLTAAPPGSTLSPYKSNFNYGDGVATFGIPDLRGLTPRGLDLGAGIDADRVTAGLQSKPGSRQADAIRSNVIVPLYGKGVLTFDGNDLSLTSDASNAPGGNAPLKNILNSGFTGSDTRGSNVGLMWLLKT